MGAGGLGPDGLPVRCDGVQQTVVPFTEAIFTPDIEFLAEHSSQLLEHALVVGGEAAELHVIGDDLSHRFDGDDGGGPTVETEPAAVEREGARDLLLYDPVEDRAEHLRRDADKWQDP